VANNAGGTAFGGLRQFVTTGGPTTITLAASNITSSAATLNASVDPQGIPTSYYFEWGSTTNYTNYTATNSLTQNLGSNQLVSAALNNLLGGTTNHFQIVAYNANGTNFGGDVEFVTLTTPPTVSIQPSSGYFPECQTITVTSSVTNVYYTEDGTAVSTNSSSITDWVLTGSNYVGTFQWCNNQADLTTLQLIAVGNGATSAVLNGSTPATNVIGFARGPANGIGSYAFIPIVLDLRSNASAETLQFRVEVTPTSPSTPMISSLELLPIGSNDFVQMIGPAPGNAAISLSTLAYTTSSNGQGLLVYTQGPGGGLDIQGFGVVGLLSFQIPDSASVNQTYNLNILYPSATEVGGQIGIPLTNMPYQTLTVSNLPYLAGDSAPAYGYSSEEFGDGILDNRDVNNAIYIATGVKDIPVNSDIYNSMCVLPQTTTLNGGGVVNYADWNDILLRSVGLDTNNWTRAWSPGGILLGTPTSAGLPGDPAVPTDTTVPYDGAQPGQNGSPPGLVWQCEASISAGTVTNLFPGNVCSLPVYANVYPGYSLAGFQFRAIVTPADGGPAVGQVTFTPAENVPEPLVTLPGQSANDIVTAWELNAFSPVLQNNSNYIGTISFQVPPTAQAGQSYAVHFSYVDGAPDETTDYNMESFPGSAWVMSTAQQKPSVTSDEWKIHFFGSTTNSIAADDADADGDGMPNWQEYLAGTDPTNPQSELSFDSSALATNGPKYITLGWLTAPDKTYILESIPALGGGGWTPINTNSGDGYTYQFIENNPGNAAFYRILLQP
jgi:hypothetical protein